jgi:hypothetical protein
LRRNPPISFSPETIALAHQVYGVKKNGRRSSRRLVNLFANKSTYASRREAVLAAAWKASRKPRKSSKRRRSSAPRGRWVIVVRGKTMPKKFRSSSSLRAYANKKYGRGYKYAWKA